MDRLDIVLFTYTDWVGVQSTPHHVARFLSANHRVLVVDMPRSVLRFLRPKKKDGGAEWQGGSLKQFNDNLWVYHPPQCFLPTGGLPHFVSRAMVALNGWLITLLLKPVLRRLSFTRPVVWSFSPMHTDAVARMKPRFLVHDIADEWINYLTHPGDRELVDRIDKDLTRRADLVFVFSNAMRAKRVEFNPETHTILPAGDVPHFGLAALASTRIPEEMANLPKPIVGAICVVEPARFDTALIVQMAQAHPEWSIVLLGPVRGVDTQEMLAHANVRILNPERAVLPGYLKAFDAAIIPYKLNEATRGIYPMKTQEYLAAGKPVISPRLPECAALHEVIDFADDIPHFIALTEQALATDTPEKTAARIAEASCNDWSNRCEERMAHFERVWRTKGLPLD